MRHGTVFSLITLCCNNLQQLFQQKVILKNGQTKENIVILLNMGIWVG